MYVLYTKENIWFERIFQIIKSEVRSIYFDIVQCHMIENTPNYNLSFV